MKPKEITDFPDINTLMPVYSDIPSEFRSLNRQNKWLEFQSDWFYHGLENLNITAKEGIDKNIALRHLAEIQRSWAPKHEHKMAAVAYLASLWFDDVNYTLSK